MANNDSKKPSIQAFTKAVKELGGNLTKVAEYFGVSRGAIYIWRDNDPKFKKAIKNERCKLFDEVLATSRVVALGIPKYDFEYGPDGEPLYDKNGRPVKRMVGWAVPPDSNMLRYFMSVYGRYDVIGFADTEDTGDVPQVVNGINIDQWIQDTNDGVKEEKPKKKRKSKIKPE